jgi:hypothetical protein
MMLRGRQRAGKK